MGDILQLIEDNYESFGFLIMCAGAFILIGREKTRDFIVTIISGLEEEFLVNADNKIDQYADYIYSKLPRRAKIFVTRKLVKKLVSRIIKEMKK